MKDRLAQIIAYKTAGKKRKFCDFIGWSPQYLQKLLAGENFGLKPIVTLAEKMPELNLRWLLLGDGEMIDPRDVHIRQKDALLDFVRAGLQAEQYVAVMTADERKVFECKLRSGIVPLFEPFERAELDERLDAHLRAKDADLSLQINKDETL